MADDGACFVLYGLLERSAAIAATGGATLIAAVAAYVLDLAQLGLVLEIVTGIVFTAGAAVVGRGEPGRPDARAAGHR